jgi:hypothetical protein
LEIAYFASAHCFEGMNYHMHHTHHPEAGEMLVAFQARYDFATSFIRRELEKTHTTPGLRQVIHFDWW